MESNLTLGSELHRIKPYEEYDHEEFEKLHKICKPYIRRLSRHIDHTRLGISNDILQGYFWDKFLFIYQRYIDCEFEHKKANLLVGLNMYSKKMMKACYGSRAVFNQSQVSMEDLFDNSKEDVIDEPDNSDFLVDRLNEFMITRLTADEYVVYQAMIDPPPFIALKVDQESKGKLSILHLIDYFEFPRNNKSYNYFNKIRARIAEVVEEAKVTMH